MINAHATYCQESRCETASPENNKIRLSRVHIRRRSAAATTMHTVTTGTYAKTISLDKHGSWRLKRDGRGARSSHMHNISSWLPLGIDFPGCAREVLELVLFLDSSAFQIAESNNNLNNTISTPAIQPAPMIGNNKASTRRLVRCIARGKGILSSGKSATMYQEKCSISVEGEK